MKRIWSYIKDHNLQVGFRFISSLSLSLSVSLCLSLCLSLSLASQRKRKRAFGVPWSQVVNVFFSVFCMF
jgi:hypothetical protein